MRSKGTGALLRVRDVTRSTLLFSEETQPLHLLAHEGTWILWVPEEQSSPLRAVLAEPEGASLL